VKGGEMTLDELKEYLEDLQKHASGSEVFQKVLYMLQENQSNDARELLETWLMGYAFHPDCESDQLNTLALYWKTFLYGEDLRFKSKSMNRLFLLSKHNSIAYSILQEFLGDEPNDENLKNKHRSLFNDEINRKH
jgi:hypothetical protein